MKLEVKNNCPLNKFKPCKEFECAWFLHVRGQDPNTGKDVDDYACAMAWTPLLLIENAMHTRHNGAAVESFRNEMVKANKASQEILLETAKRGDNLIQYKDVTDE